MSNSVPARVFVALAAAMVGVAASHPAQEMVPLTDMGERTYDGIPGGLYPNASNVPPAEHAAVGVQRAQSVQPLDSDGRPDPNGRYVLLSIGMSNTTQEFCSQSGRPPCDAWTFMGQAAVEPRVARPHRARAQGALPESDAGVSLEPRVRRLCDHRPESRAVRV